LKGDAKLERPFRMTRHKLLSKLNRYVAAISRYKIRPSLPGGKIRNDSDLIEFVNQSIEDADRNISKLILPSGRRVLRMQGMSSQKIRHCLNNICSLVSVNYLEIGVHQGSTFIAANFGNDMHSAIAIDNWSQFGGPSETFASNCGLFLKKQTFQFYDEDCFAFDKSRLKNKVNVYFYDAAYSYEAQYQAFVYFDDVFDDPFIAIVDDYKFDEVKGGTQDSFKTLGYKVLKEWHLKSSTDAIGAEWWNDFYIAVIKK
jgi:hypothetical protein